VPDDHDRGHRGKHGPAGHQQPARSPATIRAPRAKADLIAIVCYPVAGAVVTTHNSSSAGRPPRRKRPNRVSLAGEGGQVQPGVAAELAVAGVTGVRSVDDRRKIVMDGWAGYGRPYGT
jgi:hypothetical protein